MAEQVSCLALIFIGPQMSEWMSCNRIWALIASPKGFLVTCSVKQCSHTNKSINDRGSSKPSLGKWLIQSWPICPNHKCQTMALIETLLLKETNELLLLLFRNWE